MGLERRNGNGWIEGIEKRRERDGRSGMARDLMIASGKDIRDERRQQ